MSTVAEMALVVEGLVNDGYSIHDIFIEYATGGVEGIADSGVLTPVYEMADNEWARVLELVILWHLQRLQAIGYFQDD